MALIQLSDNIFCLPSSEKPLSCDVVFVRTEDSTWIYDVGVCAQAADEINAVQGKKNIVISHFHPDHVMNLRRISYTNLYVSKNTRKYLLKGNVIEGCRIFDEKPAVQVLELPSSHAKGCLCLISGDFAFLGDGTYCKPIKGLHFYNAQLLQKMIESLEKIDAKYFCLSHDRHFVQPKESVIALYKEIYGRRKSGNPFISVEDYFV